MKTLRDCLGIGIVLGLLFCPCALTAQSVVRWADVFPEQESLPSPQLEIDAPYLSIRLVGHDSDSVVVVVSAPGAGLVALPTPVRRGGLVRFDHPRNQTTTTLEVHVPRRTHVRVRTSNGGSVVIRDVHGAVEVENSNAAIELTGLRGPVVAATSNGAITATFDELPASGPLSFLTSNAPVTLTIPGGSDADLVLETDGRIHTDPVFTATLTNQRGQQRTGPALVGSIGSGGVEIRVRTDNNDIQILNPQ